MWKFIRILPGGILMVAAMAKIVWAPQLLHSQGLLSSWWLLMGAVFVETFAGLFIAWGPLICSWRATMGIFGFLAIVAGYSLWTNQECNCFGSRIGSNVTLPLDLAILLMCGLFAPRKCDNQSARSFGAVISSALVVATALTVVLTIRTMNAPTHDPIAFFLAKSMLKKEWPLGRRHHPELSKLEEGRWLVLLVREDCVHCRNLMERLSANPNLLGNDKRIATLVSRDGEWHLWLDQFSMDPSEHKIIWSGSEPFFSSPAAFLLEDGIVVEGEDAGKVENLVEALLRLST
jgi:hypothetical protein